MPQHAVDAYLNQPVLSGGKVVSGTHGMTIAQVEEDVLRGGRFLMFSWNFSVLIMSFRRASPLTYVRSDQWVGPRALLWTIPSFFVGWWGIPWGIVFTIQSFYRNSVGGHDVTSEVMQSLVGPQRASGIMARVGKRPADPVLWLLRLACIAVPLAIISLFVFAVNDAPPRHR